jgi:hypothetical protein
MWGKRGRADPENSRLGREEGGERRGDQKWGTSFICFCPQSSVQSLHGFFLTVGLSQV